MRLVLVLPILLVAACGSGEESPTNKAAPKAASLAAGQWELTAETGNVRTLDQGTPKIEATSGARITETVCVGSDTRPPTALFAGAGYQCRYENYYLRNGRINITLSCSREGMQGTIDMSADGSFDGETLQYDRNLRTSLAGDGDVEIDARVTGRRTGQCTPETPVANEAAPQEG